MKGKETIKALIPCKKEKLCILGTASTLEATPWEDEDMEIWGVAQVTTYPVFKRADVLFELHQESYWKEKNIIDRLNRFDGPTYMQQKYPEVPKSVKFDIDELIKRYPRYHTTSISYMLAAAFDSFVITGKPGYVAMFGIHMDTREEYQEQRPCCEYWIGMMRGAGMIVDPSPAGAILASNGLYAFEGYHPAIPKLSERIDGLRNGLDVLNREIAEVESRKWRQVGAIEEAELWLRQFQTGDISKGKGEK